MKDLKGLKSFNGLPSGFQTAGKTLCMEIYMYLEGMSPKDFNMFVKTPVGGAMMFIANQYAREFDKPVFYNWMYEPDA